MSLSPRISVIVPVYQTGAYLPACLESLIAQTFGRIEILCVDDGSTDDSAQVLADYAARDGRIRVLRHARNQGLGAARNTAIAAAAAPFLSSVDSDDRLEPDLLERLWRARERAGADIVSSGFQRVTPAGEVLGLIRQKPPRHRAGRVDVFESLLPSFCAKLWRRSLFIDHDLRFPTGVMYEDIATTPRAVYFADRLECLEDCGYLYTQRDGSITRRASKANVYDLMAAFDGLYAFFSRREEAEVWLEMLFEKMGRSFTNYLRGSAQFQDPEAVARQARLLAAFRDGLAASGGRLAGGSIDALLAHLRAPAPGQAGRAG